MKVLVEAHRYELENFEKKDEQGQILQFIQKEPAGDSLVTISDGTYLNTRFPISFCR